MHRVGLGLGRRGIEDFRGEAAEAAHTAHSLRLGDTPAAIAGIAACCTTMRFGD